MWTEFPAAVIGHLVPYHEVCVKLLTLSLSLSLTCPHTHAPKKSKWVVFSVCSRYVKLNYTANWEHCRDWRDVFLTQISSSLQNLSSDCTHLLDQQTRKTTRHNTHMHIWSSGSLIYVCWVFCCFFFSAQVPGAAAPGPLQMKWGKMWSRSAMPSGYTFTHACSCVMHTDILLSQAAPTNTWTWLPEPDSEGELSTLCVCVCV